MRLAKWVFRVAGISGVLMVLPPYFLEEQFGRDQPPPINHPELYYGFVGVTLSWQFLFLVIGSDPIRFRPAMLPSLLEKASFAVAIPIEQHGFQGMVESHETAQEKPMHVLKKETAPR